jgi:arylsulfatase A-like enzyme
MVGAAALIGPRGLRAAGGKKPNIIFVLSDDLAQGDLGCYGQKLIKTPRLDRMAAEGTRFTQAYCGTSVCAPSRSSLITGLHMGHCPIRANREIQPEGQMPLPAGTVTVAQILKDAGYATACIGKWGMGMFDTTGSPLKVGFDHFFGYNCQRHAHSYFPTYLYRDDQRFELPGNDGKGVGKIYAQNLIANEVLDWVRKHKEGPFFLFHSVTLPHGRFEIDDTGQYAGTDWTAQQRNYAAMVTRLDSDIGRLLDLLKELRIDENTIVFVAGDNGSSFPPASELGRHFQRRPTACVASSASCTRGACARRRSSAGRARSRRAGSPRSRGRSGISSRRRWSWPGQSRRPRSSRMACLSCRSSGAALHPSESTSTGSCTSSRRRFGPCGSVTGKPCARVHLPPSSCMT